MDPVISYLEHQANRALFILAATLLVFSAILAYVNPTIAITLFGTLAGVFTSIRFLPQVYLSVRTRDTKSLSLAFLIITFSQAYFLILYGIAKPDYLIAGMNILPLICTAILIYLKWREKSEMRFTFPIVPPWF